MGSNFLSDPIIGISCSRSAATAVRVRRGWGRCTYEELVRIEMENLVDPADGYGKLGEALRDVAGHLASSGAIFRVAIPGPLVQTVVLRLQERPRSRGEAEALIAWQVNRQTGAGRPRRAAAHCISAARNDHRLYGIAIDEPLYRRLEESFSGRVLDAVDAASTVRWNGLPAAVRNQPGVMMEIHEDCWTLTMWGDSLHPALIKSGWFTPDKGVPEADRISREVLRLLASAGHHHPDQRQYILAFSELAESLGKTLQQTTGISFEWLAPEFVTGAARVHGLPPELALSPAVEIACAS
jgi:hypothetical protein